MRYIVILLIGVCAGYTYGFHDAQHNEKPIVTRLVDQAGGVTRSHMKNDVDKQMNEVERR